MKNLGFQKMNIEGSDILSRLQMKKIAGGVAAPYCIQTYIVEYDNHPIFPQFHEQTIRSEYSGTCAEQSAKANAFCVNELQNWNALDDRCQYDCSCDGIGT